MKLCDPNDCPVADRADFSRFTKGEKQRLAEYYYSLTPRPTMEWIGERLGAKKNTVSRWLSNCSGMEQLKPAKTKANPKGAGRPAGRKKPAKKPGEIQIQVSANVAPDEWERFKAEAIKEGISAAAKLGAVISDPEVDAKTLSPTAQQKLDAALRQQQRRQDADFEQRVTEEVKRRTETALPHLKAKQERADKISASYTPRFSKKDCLGVARCLHSDTWQSLNVPPELASRLKAAFVIFTKMQSFLCVE